MKKKYITLLFSAFLFLAGLNTLKAQDPFLQFGGAVPAKDTAVAVNKTHICTKMVHTPWIIQFGPDIVLDNGSRSLKAYKLRNTNDFYPIHCSAEKHLKKGWSIQGVLSSETINPHHFGSLDLNAKYSFFKTIGDAKWFDMYALLGLGYTYRDYPHGEVHLTTVDNSYNANIGGGANIWLFKNAGIFGQALAKFNMHQSEKNGGGNYIQLSAGVVFKIGGEAVVTKVAVVEPKVIPSTYKRPKEAEDAANYLREILNK